MEKISPPLRIALVAVVVLAAVWFVALRPKAPAEEAPLPTAPGMTGLTNDIQKARDAKEASDAAAKSAQQAAASVDGAQGSATASKGASVDQSSSGATATAEKGATVTTPNGSATVEKSVTVKAKPKPKAKPAPAAKSDPDPAKPLVAALRRGRVVVLLFRSRSADSQAVADAVRAVPKQTGKVAVRVASIGDVGKYATFTEKTTVAQAPTVLVIAPSRKAKVIVGYTSTAEVLEAVRDLRR